MPRAAALFARQLPLAAAERDGRSPRRRRVRRHARRTLNSRMLAGDGGRCWRWCRRLSSSSSWTCGLSTSRSRRCSATSLRRRCRMSRGSSMCTPSSWPRCCCRPGGSPTASGAGSASWPAWSCSGCRVAGVSAPWPLDLLALIAWRALQAAGAAVLLPTSLGLALGGVPVTSARHRRRDMGRWSRAVAAGSGPVVGGLAGRVGARRWIFLINPARYPRPPWRRAWRSCRGAPMCQTAGGAPGESMVQGPSWSWARWAWCAPR